MARITKSIAKIAARELLAARKKEIEGLELLKKVTLHKIVSDAIPDEVMKVFKKHPIYFSSSKWVYFQGPGIQRSQYDIAQKTPYPNDWGTPFNLSQEQADTIVDIETNLDKKHAEYKTLFSNVEQAILSLSTYAKVQEFFPEAFPFLPPVSKISTAVAIDLAKVRCSVNPETCK